MIIKICFLSVMVFSAFASTEAEYLKMLEYERLAKLEDMARKPEEIPTFSATCDDLHTVTSFNDLLTQVYRHLDDKCFFLMPKSELSKKLGINVVSNGQAVVDLKKVPYKSIRNGVFF